MFYFRSKNPQLQKKKTVQKNLFFFYEAWRLADIKHKYIILYMSLCKHIIFCLSKTIQNGKEDYTSDLLIAL